MKRIISIQFKNRNNDFVGKSYDFLLNKEEETPKVGDIIRLMNNEYDYLFYGTRVKIVDVKVEKNASELEEVRYVESSLDE